MVCKPTMEVMQNPSRLLQLQEPSCADMILGSKRVQYRNFLPSLLFSPHGNHMCVTVCVWERECVQRERERERERERKLLQTRSINSSDGFDPLRLTATINIKASLPPNFPLYLTCGRKGLCTCVC